MVNDLIQIPLMARKNPHVGSSFESWLDEEGLRKEAAAKAVIALRLAREMKKNITKQRMAKLVKTSRAQVDPVFIDIHTGYSLSITPPSPSLAA